MLPQLMRNIRRAERPTSPRLRRDLAEARRAKPPCRKVAKSGRYRKKATCFLDRRSDLLPFNHSVELVSMSYSDDKPKVARDWIAFVVAWIPYSLLTYRFWYNVDDAFISFRYAKNWGDGVRTSLQPGAAATGRGIQQLPVGSRLYVLSSTWNSTLLSGHRCSVSSVVLCSCTLFFERSGKISTWGLV